MNPYALLFPLTLLMCTGSYLSYNEVCKKASWFPWATGLLSLLTGLLWAYTARQVVGRQLYTVSLFWDMITVLSYSVFPVIVSGVRLSGISVLGLLLVILGALIVKWGE